MVYAVYEYATFMEMLLTHKMPEMCILVNGGSQWSRENEALLKSCGLHSNTKRLCPVHVDCKQTDLAAI